MLGSVCPLSSRAMVDLLEPEQVVRRRELNTRRLSANALTRALRVPSGRIVDILNGEQSRLRRAAPRGARSLNSHVIGPGLCTENLVRVDDAYLVDTNGVWWRGGLAQNAGDPSHPTEALRQPRSRKAATTSRRFNSCKSE